jgi:hypothetical protein
MSGQGENVTLFMPGTNVNANIFDWESGAYYYNVRMTDFSIHGNNDNQAGAGPYRGIECDISDAATTDDEYWAYLLYLKNVMIKQCKGRGLMVKTVSGNQTALEASDMRISQNGGGGESHDVYLERTWDGFIDEAFVASMELFKGVTNYGFSDIYFAGGAEKKVVRLHGCTAANPNHGNRWDNCFFDNVANGNDAESGCLVIEDHTWNNTFAGCTFGRNSTASTANVGPQVLILDDAMHHKFLGCSWYHPSVLTRTFTYAFETRNNSDWNVWTGAISQHDRPASGINVYANDPVFWLLANANGDTAHMVIN